MPLASTNPERLQIGIVGGGQLAAMLVAAGKHESDFWVLDPDPGCPAALAGGQHVPGSPTDRDAIATLSEYASVVTLDLENVAVAGLEDLAAAGVRVIPGPVLLERMTDKLEQKRLLQSLDIPTAPFVATDGREPFDSPWGYPVVQKAARGGYDGRGVFVLHSEGDMDDRLRTDGFLEQYIERRMEVSVMVAAGEGGEVRSYAPVEMVFRETGNILDYLIAPARIENDIAEAAVALANRTIRALGNPGLYGIEMFLTPDNILLVNEISPRAHNSGHYTMEACTYSQFDQQRRIIAGEALLPTTQETPAVMFNLLGLDGWQGDTVIEADDSLEGAADVFIHTYGKTTCNPGRKMGHVTVTADTVDSAITRAMTVREQVHIRGSNPL
ncbi:MAG: 5-(carboxyamino)imidazole ribonucleotide synthase [Gammaproteobacteria bacterium]|nr:5-(carboxyamino)imidazole ribonucleotide synthase [Gammaproteobacteria bacterium]RPG23581.1 MAG: 5-(carboxyamino)imidazole ribonucleotide synthase [Gammaproteobacteria bacterium TMED50]